MSRTGKDYLSMLNILDQNQLTKFAVQKTLIYDILKDTKVVD